MKIKIRKDFCCTDGFTMEARDNIVITLSKSEMDLLEKRGFVTHLGYPASQIFIGKEANK